MQSLDVDSAHPSNKKLFLLPLGIGVISVITLKLSIVWTKARARGKVVQNQCAVQNFEKINRVEFTILSGQKTRLSV